MCDHCVTQTNDDDHLPCCEATEALGIPCACRVHVRFRDLVRSNPERYVPAAVASSRALAGLPPDPSLTPKASRPDRPLPPLGRQVANFVRAQIRHVADGRVKATPEALAARLAVCNACPMLRASDRRCSATGCGCPVDTKATYRSESCPLGKWPTSIPEPIKENS